MHCQIHNATGRIYTGLADGRIIRLAVDLQSYETVVRTGKPPFDECGMKFYVVTCSHCCYVLCACIYFQKAHWIMKSCVADH